MTNATNTASTWFSTYFKGWSVKLAGEKPSDEMLATALAFGRPGKQSLALAMAMRPDGVTAGQILAACGNPQNNHRAGLIEAGLFKRVPMGNSVNNHTVYKVELTGKGTKRLEAVQKRVAEAAAAGEADKAKPKAKAAKKATKARKAKGDTAPAITNDQPPVNLPAVTGDQPPADQPQA